MPPLAPYTPDATDDTKPSDYVSGGYAATEIRALKTRVNSVNSTLGAAVTAEASARASADSTLSTAISAEATARANADTTINNTLTAVKANAVFVLGTIAGSAQAITAVSNPSHTSIPTNTAFVFTPATNNTGADPVITIDGLAGITLRKAGQELVANDLVAGQPVLFVFNGTYGNVLNPVTPATTAQKWYEGSVTNNGSVAWSGTHPTGWTLNRDSEGAVTVTHNLGTDDYRLAPGIVGNDLKGLNIYSKGINSFTIHTNYNSTGVSIDANFDFILKLA